MKSRITFFQVHNLPCGVTAILATNGFVYFTSLLGEDIQIHQHIDSHVRESICRLRQVTKVLAKHRVQLYDLSLLYGEKMKDLSTSKNIPVFRV